MMRSVNLWSALALVLLLALGCEEVEPASDGPAYQGLSGKADSAGKPSMEMDWPTIATRCTPPADDEPVIFSSDFIWGDSLEGMAQRFVEMYASEKRLSGRVYFDPEQGTFVLPCLKAWGGQILLSTRLIENVRRHVEKALLRGYAEFVFFPDMGHSHLFVPQNRWDETYAGRPVDEWSAMYAELFADPELKVLYHTAEQLQVMDVNNELLDNRHLRWRFFTRNIVGDNAYLSRLELLHDPDHMANTARDMPGHHYQGAGFNISANQNGCFPYVHEGELYWFDISLSDPLPDPGANDLFI